MSLEVVETRDDFQYTGVGIGTDVSCRRGLSRKRVK